MKLHPLLTPSCHSALSRFTGFGNVEEQHKLRLIDAEEQLASSAESEVKSGKEGCGELLQR